VQDTAASIEKVAESFAYLGADRLDRLDGLTVIGDTWWFNLRPSNTEPLLRLNLEAATKAECDARTERVLALVREG
jgi:phosphomannomutase